MKNKQKTRELYHDDQIWIPKKRYLRLLKKLKKTEDRLEKLNWIWGDMI